MEMFKSFNGKGWNRDLILQGRKKTLGFLVEAFVEETFAVGALVVGALVVAAFVVGGLVVEAFVVEAFVVGAFVVGTFVVGRVGQGVDPLGSVGHGVCGAPPAVVVVWDGFEVAVGMHVFAAIAEHFMAGQLPKKHLALQVVEQGLPAQNFWIGGKLNIFCWW